MKRTIVAVLVAFLAVVGFTGCEPKMTIQARSAHSVVTCGTVLEVGGAVSPANATPKVVLQRTVAGKWKDAKGWTTVAAFKAGDVPTVRESTVNQSTGEYRIYAYVETMATQHLRVRSAGGGGMSPAFFVTPLDFTPPCTDA